MERFSVTMLITLMLCLVSCNNEEDNFYYPDNEYGVYIIQTSGGDLGRLVAKYDLNLYPYIGVEGTLQYGDFEMMKHLQKTLMYLNLEKVNIESYKKENGELIEENVLHQDYMLLGQIYAFPLLKTMILPKNLKKIGKKAFLGSNLEKLIAYNNLTSIEDSAFTNNQVLSEINLPQSLSHIGEAAFRGCTSLTRIHIPAGVKTIHDTSFDNRYVKSIHIKSKVPPVLEMTKAAFSGYGSTESKPTVYVPKGSKARYDSDVSWSNYLIKEE